MRRLLQCGRMSTRLLLMSLTALILPFQSFGQTSTAQGASNLTSLRQRAEAGDIKAQFELGFLYENGAGGAERDTAEALKWYRKAADQGDLASRHSLAAMYFEGNGVPKDYTEAASWYRCPQPNTSALENCKQISRKDLPQGALELLAKMKCGASSNYDYGSAVDLNADGDPEYQVCCGDAPHGPCSAVVIGKVGSVWKDLTAKEGVAGFTPACGLFLVLEGQHGGYSDVCLPNQCSMVSSPAGKPCVPTIWNWIDGHYQSVKYTPGASPK